MTETEARERPRQHRVPVSTVVCLAAALGVLLLLALAPLPSPYVFGYLRLGGLLLCAPPALGLLGCAGALLDRRLRTADRRVWAVGSALAGFLGVVALLVVVTFVSGP